jgi:hypothetical protein
VGGWVGVGLPFVVLLINKMMFLNHSVNIQFLNIQNRKMEFLSCAYVAKTENIYRIAASTAYRGYASCS